MAGRGRWYFSREQLASSPSRKCGIDPDKELSYRQQAAQLIQDMGQRLSVTQLCINTAIVYMHRFYVFHSFTKFHRTHIAACALFLSAKVEEQPRKLEHVIKVANMCITHNKVTLTPQQVQEESARLVKHENIMLQTLGFDIAIEHPHTFVVKCCQLIHASKDLSQTCYFMATNSLHLTTMCLQYRPAVVACVCIHLACKWSSWEIPKSSEGKDWYFYVDPEVTAELLESLTKEFLDILQKCPSRLRRNVMAGKGHGSGSDKLASPHQSDHKDVSSPASTSRSPSVAKSDIKPSSQELAQQPRPSSTITESSSLSTAMRNESVVTSSPNNLPSTSGAVRIKLEPPSTISLSSPFVEARSVTSTPPASALTSLSREK